MNTLARLAIALLTAFTALVIVVGALLVALSEGKAATVMLPTVAIPLSTAGAVVAQPLPQPTLPPSTRIIPPSPTAFIATTCPIPPGWSERAVQPGDTLENLAALTGTAIKTLSMANCLMSGSLLVGSIIFLPPPVPTLTPLPQQRVTYIPCGPPYGWVRYRVRPGDTLFKLSLALNVSVFQLQSANCLGDATLIRTGDVLYTPFLPPIRPPSPSVTASNTAVPTAETRKLLKLLPTRSNLPAPPNSHL